MSSIVKLQELYLDIRFPLRCTQNVLRYCNSKFPRDSPISDYISLYHFLWLFSCTLINGVLMFYLFIIEMCLYRTYHRIGSRTNETYVQANQYGRRFCWVRNIYYFNIHTIVIYVGWLAIFARCCPSLPTHVADWGMLKSLSCILPWISETGRKLFKRFVHWFVGEIRHHFPVH